MSRYYPREPEQEMVALNSILGPTKKERICHKKRVA